MSPLPMPYIFFPGFALDALFAALPAGFTGAPAAPLENLTQHLAGTRTFDLNACIPFVRF